MVHDESSYRLFYEAEWKNLIFAVATFWCHFTEPAQQQIRSSLTPIWLLSVWLSTIYPTRSNIEIQGIKIQARFAWIKDSDWRGRSDEWRGQESKIQASWAHSDALTLWPGPILSYYTVLLLLHSCFQYKLQNRVVWENKADKDSNSMIQKLLWSILYQTNLGPKPTSLSNCHWIHDSTFFWTLFIFFLIGPITDLWTIKVIILKFQLSIIVGVGVGIEGCFILEL